MKQQDIFEYAAQGSYGGTFVIGSVLPESKGKTSLFHIITIEASRGETTSRLLSRIIASYDEKPLRIAEARSRQIKALFMGTIRNKKKIALIINNAELLSLGVLRALKLLRETMSQENAWPGVILLGETEKIIHTVKKNKGMAAASVRISDTGFVSLYS